MAKEWSAEDEKLIYENWVRGGGTGSMDDWRDLDRPLYFKPEPEAPEVPEPPPLEPPKEEPPEAAPKEKGETGYPKPLAKDRQAFLEWMSEEYGYFSGEYWGSPSIFASDETWAAYAPYRQWVDKGKPLSPETLKAAREEEALAGTFEEIIASGASDEAKDASIRERFGVDSWEYNQWMTQYAGEQLTWETQQGVAAFEAYVAGGGTEHTTVEDWVAAGRPPALGGEFDVPPKPTEMEPEGYKWNYNSTTGQWELILDPYYEAPPTPGPAGPFIEDNYGRRAYWTGTTYDHPPDWGIDPATLEGGYLPPTGPPAEMSDYQQAMLDLEQQEFEWRQQQDGQLSPWQEEQLRLSREQIELEREQFGELSAWQQAQLEQEQQQYGEMSAWQQAQIGLEERQYGEMSAWQQAQIGLEQQQFGELSAYQQAQMSLEEQELAWRREQHGTLSAYQEQELALAREQLAQEQKNYLAGLAAEPHSWLEYSKAAGEQPVIQPWMLPLMPQEYEQLGAGAPIPGWGDTTPPAITAPPYTVPPAITGNIQPTGGGSTMPSYQGTPQYGGVSPGGYQRPATSQFEPTGEIDPRTGNPIFTRIDPTQGRQPLSREDFHSMILGGGGLATGGQKMRPSMPAMGGATEASEPYRPSTTPVPMKSGRQLIWDSNRGWVDVSQQNIPEYEQQTQPTQYSDVVSPAGGGQPSDLAQWQGGQAIPSQPDPSQMPGLTRPSRQYQARMGPTALGQYAGYQQMTTGIRPEELEFRLWSMAPPGGRHSGLTYVR